MRAEIPDYKLEEMFLEALNEIHGPVTICGYEYEAGRALKDVDPVAFRCGLSDWLDSQIGELFVCLDDKYYLKEETEDQNGES